MKFYFVSCLVIGLCFLLCNGQKRKEIRNKKRVKHISTKIYRPTKEMYSKYLSMNPPRFPPTFIHTRLRVPHERKIKKLKWKPRSFYIRSHKIGNKFPKSVTRTNNKDTRRTSPKPFPTTRRIYRGKGIPGRKHVRRKIIPKIKEFVPQTKPVLRQTIHPKNKQIVRKIPNFLKRTIPVYTTTIKPKTQRPVMIFEPAPSVIPAIGPKMTKGPPQFDAKIGLPTPRPLTPVRVLKIKPSIKIIPGRQNYDSRITSFRPLPVVRRTTPVPMPVVQVNIHPKPVLRITTKRPKTVWQIITARPKLTKPTIRPRPEIFTRRPTTRQKPFSPIILIRPKQKPERPAQPIRRRQSTLPPINRKQTILPPIIVPPLLPSLFEEVPIPPVLIRKKIKKIRILGSTPQPPAKTQPTPNRGDSPITNPVTTIEPLSIVMNTPKYVIRGNEDTTKQTTAVPTTKLRINTARPTPTVATTEKLITYPTALRTTTKILTTTRPSVFKVPTTHVEPDYTVGIIPQAETTRENILTTMLLDTTTANTTPKSNVQSTESVTVHKDIVVNSMSPIYPHFTTSGNKLTHEKTESTTIGRQIIDATTRQESTFTSEKTTTPNHVKTTERHMPVVKYADSIYTTIGEIIQNILTTVVLQRTTTEKATSTTISTTTPEITTTTPEITTTTPDITTTTPEITTTTKKTTPEITTTPEVTTTPSQITTTVKHKAETESTTIGTKKLKPTTTADMITYKRIPSYLFITPESTTSIPSTTEQIQMKHSLIVTGIPLYLGMLADHFTTTTEETKTIKGIFVHLPEFTTTEGLLKTTSNNKEDDTGSYTSTTQETSDVASVSQSTSTYLENKTGTTTISPNPTSQAKPSTTEAMPYTTTTTSTSSTTNGMYDIYTETAQFDSVPLTSTTTNDNLITNESSTIQSVYTTSNSVAGLKTTVQRSTTIPSASAEQLSTVPRSQEPTKPSTTTVVPLTESIFNTTAGVISSNSTETTSSPSTSTTMATTSTPQFEYRTSTTTTPIPSTTTSTTMATTSTTMATTSTPQFEYRTSTTTTPIPSTTTSTTMATTSTPQFEYRTSTTTTPFPSTTTSTTMATTSTPQFEYRTSTTTTPIPSTTTSTTMATTSTPQFEYRTSTTTTPIPSTTISTTMATTSTPQFEYRTSTTTTPFPSTTTSTTMATTSTPQFEYRTSTTTTPIPNTTTSTTSTTELIPDMTTTRTGQNPDLITTMIERTTMSSEIPQNTTTGSSHHLENTTSPNTTYPLSTMLVTPGSTTVAEQGGCISVGCPNGRQCVTKTNAICSPNSGGDDCFCIPGCRLENMYIALGQPVIIDRCGNLCYCSSVGLTACTKLPCNRNKYATSTINPFKPVEFKPDIKDRGPTRGDAPYFYEDNSKSMRVHGLHFPEQSLAWLSPFSSEFRDKLPMSGLKEISIDDLFKT